MPKRDHRPLTVAFWQPVEQHEPAAEAIYWACSKCGDILMEGPPDRFRRGLYLCLCGCLNEVPQADTSR